MTEDIGALLRLENKLLWLASWAIHNADRPRGNENGPEVRDVRPNAVEDFSTVFVLNGYGQDKFSQLSPKLRSELIDGPPLSV